VRRLALALGLLLALARGAEAALPAPPFALDVTPSRAAPGQPVQLALTPRGGTGAWDVYVMWAFSPEAAFLTPQGEWSPRPVAFRARTAASGPPITTRWVVNRAGDIPLALVVVEPGGDPLARFTWTFRPEITWLSAPAPAAPAPFDASTLAPLAVLTLLGCALILLTGGAFRA
jgi:hypothetical protein